MGWGLGWARGLQASIESVCQGWAGLGEGWSQYCGGWAGSQQLLPLLQHPAPQPVRPFLSSTSQLLCHPGPLALQLLADGKLEEARAACAEQMDQAHAQLEASDDFRAEYFALWEQQRKAPVLLPGGAWPTVPLYNKALCSLLSSSTAAD